jgi:hypothetical protein
MNNVKVIHLDGQDFSIESGSTSDSTTSSQVDINELDNKEKIQDVANPGVVVAATAGSPDGGADKKNQDDSESECSDCNTTDLLASDPLYFILSRMFITPEGKNIASVLNEINTKLDKLLASRNA